MISVIYAGTPPDRHFFGWFVRKRNGHAIDEVMR